MALPLCHDGAEIGDARDAERPAQSLRGQPPWCFDPMRTVSCFRPFLRRRESTSRPHRVAMRVRNPCLLMRLRLRGRYEGFTSTSQTMKNGAAVLEGVEASRGAFTGQG